jgi:CDP-glucose 4,6-dehydratase
MLLEKGAEVTGIVRKVKEGRKMHSGSYAEEEADIRDAERLEEIFGRHRPEFCFHFAAKAVRDGSAGAENDFLGINVKGTCNLLEACVSAGTKNVALASTTHVYGSSSEKEVAEDSALKGRDGYALSKTGAESAGRAFASACGMNVFSLRCSNVYGGNDLNFSRLVPAKIKELLQGRRPSVRRRGDEIDLVHVDDAARAFLLAMQKAGELKGMSINICSGRPVKVAEVAEMLAKAGGKETEVIYEVPEGRETGKTTASGMPERAETGKAIVSGTPAGTEGTKARFSNKLAKELIGWQPEKSPEKGLKETYEWYRKYLNG